MILGSLIKLSKVTTPLLPHQQRVVNRIQQPDQPGLVVVHGLGSGKAEVVTNKVLTPTGQVPIGSLKVGDYVISQDGCPTKVTGIYPQGFKDIYRVSFRDEVSVEVCREHLWLTQTHKERKNFHRSKEEFRDRWVGQVRSTIDIKDSLITGKQWNHAIPTVLPAQFEEQPIGINPYLLGLLLGDGGLTTRGISFTSADEEILVSIRNTLGADLQLVKNGVSKYGYYITKTNGRSNSLNVELTNLTLKGLKSNEKFIPEQYKINTPEVRLAILQGLMDTDGTVSKSGITITFTSTSEQLARDVLFLVQSLGGLGVIRNRVTKYTYKGIKKEGRRSYTVHITLPPEINPFRLERKASRVTPRTKYKPARYITNVEYVGKKEAVCISVEHPSHLYVTEHFIVTHNTLTSIAAQDALNSPATVIAPAALQENYKKEQAKHTDAPKDVTLKTMQDVARKGQAPDNPLLIVDEAHRAREASSKTYKALAASKNQKRLLLTGSPFYNHPVDVAPLINLASGQKILPATKEDFSAKYITAKRTDPGFVDRVFRGVKPGTTDTLNTAKAYELQQVFNKWVDYHGGSTENFPTVERKDVEVPMTKKQLEVYDGVLGKAPAWVRIKIRKGLPPNKQESKDLNAFAAAARQISNSTRGFSPGIAEEPKIEKAFNNLQSTLGSNPRAKAVVYSNYLGTGIAPYKERLDKAKIPYGEFSGDIPTAQRDQLVKDYNEDRLKVLLLSSAGGEGLDLKGTRLMQVLEPHWNLEKIKQVEGRAARYKSHEGLPAEEQKVLVERYLATRPEEGLLQKMHLTKPDGSIDQYLSARGRDKDELISQFKRLMKKEAKE